MAPADDPQLIAYILVQHPKLKAGEIGSDPVAELFKSIMESSLKYMNIVPEGDRSNEAIALGDFTGKESAEAMTQLTMKGLTQYLLAKVGQLISQYPQQGVKLAEGTVVILKSKGQISLPDFTGWSKKMVLSYKMLSGLDIRINGNGYVTSQSLSKGTLIGT